MDAGGRAKSGAFAEKGRMKAGFALVGPHPDPLVNEAPFTGEGEK
jgi:hypothetical protein